MSFNDLEQKMKGIGNQIKGTVEEKIGHPIKGAADKAKGKTQEALADINMKLKDHEKTL